MDSAPCTSRTLTEEDLVLGVVGFVAELACEDMDPTFHEAEVTKLCEAAQQHVLAGHWLGLACLILDTVDFFNLGVAAEGHLSYSISSSITLVVE
jgi:hypothetical protein